MKKIFSMLLIMAAALIAQAQSADDIISKYIEAIGGRDKIKAITSMKVNAKLQQGGQEIPGIIYKKRPNLFELEYTVQGKTGREGFDGTDGWNFNPFSGRDYAEKMDADELKTTKFESNFDEALIDYAKKGYKVSYVGEEDADGSPAYHLALTTQEGDVYDYFLDKDSYLPVKLKAHVKMQDGSTADFETNFSDYKEAGGVLIPYTVENVQEYQGEKYSRFLKVDSVEVNVPVDDSIFKMPAK
jgi:outer membrane lipoprotein-sorting protein